MTLLAKPRVAVVEDEADLRASMVDFLHHRGYPVWSAGSAEELYRHLAGAGIDVLVLDVNLPGEDGLSVAAHLGGRGSMAVLMLSGRTGIDDRLAGLRAGANRYLTKPIDLRELVANIDAAWDALSRQSPPAAAADDDGAWRIDTVQWALVAPNERRATLTTNEYLLLLRLADEGVGQPVPKAAVDASLGGVTQDYNRIDLTLARLRKKVLDKTGEPLPVKAAHGKGLMLTVPLSRQG